MYAVSNFLRPPQAFKIWSIATRMIGIGICICGITWQSKIQLPVNLHRILRSITCQVDGSWWTYLAGFGINISFCKEPLHNFHVLWLFHSWKRRKHYGCVTCHVLLIHVTHLCSDGCTQVKNREERGIWTLSDYYDCSKFKNVFKWNCQITPIWTGED